MLQIDHSKMWNWLWKCTEHYLCFNEKVSSPDLILALTKLPSKPEKLKRFLFFAYLLMLYFLLSLFVLQLDSN